MITVAYLLFVKALSAGAVGIIVPIANSYALVTVTLSLVFGAATLSGSQYGAILAIIGGSAVLAYERNHKKLPLKELHKDTILAVAAAIFWGFAFYTVNSLVGDLNWQTITILTQLWQTPTALVIMLAVYKKQFIKYAYKPVADKQIWLMGFIGIGGAAALYLGSDYADSVVIPTVLSGMGPLIASALSAVVDHEKLSYFKRIGAVVIVAGITVLNLT